MRMSNLQSKRPVLTAKTIFRFNCDKQIMQTIRLLSLIAITQLLVSCVSTWSAIYGSGGYDAGWSIRTVTDERGLIDGYVVVGETESFGAGDLDILLLRLDAEGSILWSRTYGGDSAERATAIELVSDQQRRHDGYILLGETQSFGAGQRDIWLLRLNTDGAVVWQKTYGGDQWEGAGSVQAIMDQYDQPVGYIVAGTTDSFVGADFNNVWVVKLDLEGSIVWQRTYGWHGHDDGISIQQVIGGDGVADGFILVANTKSFPLDGDSDVWILRLDEQGAVVWQRLYGDDENNMAVAIQPTRDREDQPSGFVILGNDSGINEQRQIWILRLGLNGFADWRAV